jgi:hypothetical protein
MEATTLDGILTPAMARLVADAVSAGFKVGAEGSALNIWKGRPGRMPTAGVRLYLTETGGFYSAHRIDVRLDLALNIPTIKLTREILGL